MTCNLCHYFTSHSLLIPISASSASLQKEGVPAQLPEIVIEGEGTVTVLDPETVTVNAGGVAHDLLTGGVQGEETLLAFV